MSASAASASRRSRRGRRRRATDRRRRSRAGKLDYALRLGATDAVDAGAPDAVQQIKEITGGGAEFCIETAGVVPALELAYSATARGGVTVTAGLPHPDRKLSIQG